MKIGILDTDGIFEENIFQHKKIELIRINPWKNIYLKNNDFPYTHSEYVCSTILKESPNSELVIVSIIKENLKCSVKELIEGIEILISMQVDIINLSIGVEAKFYQELYNVCKKAVKKNIIIVSAFSNNGIDTFPAKFDNVIGVQNTNNNYSNYIFTFDSEENNIKCITDKISAYHLNQRYLLRGNSFMCAKVTGIISNLNQNELSDFLISKANMIYDWKSENKNFVFISNSLDDDEERYFVNNFINASHIFSYDRNKLEDYILNSNKDVFISHNKYSDIVQDKHRLVDIMKKGKVKVVFRYPLFSMCELYRLSLYDNVKIEMGYF